MFAEDGTKRFAKDSKKEGCFHVLGGLPQLAKTPVIIFAEGYATAATIKEAMDPVDKPRDVGFLGNCQQTLEIFNSTGSLSDCSFMPTIFLPRACTQPVHWG